MVFYRTFQKQLTILVTPLPVRPTDHFSPLESPF